MIDHNSKTPHYDNLKPQHQRFVDAFVGGKSATDAYIEAGYSAKTATVQASKLVTKGNIKAAIDERKQLAGEIALVSHAELIENLREAIRISLSKQSYKKTCYIPGPQGEPGMHEDIDFRDVHPSMFNGSIKELKTFAPALDESTEGGKKQEIEHHHTLDDFLNGDWEKDAD